MIEYYQNVPIRGFMQWRTGIMVACSSWTCPQISGPKRHNKTFYHGRHPVKLLLIVHLRVYQESTAFPEGGWAGRGQGNFFSLG